MDPREELQALRRMAELEDKQNAANNPVNDMSTGERLAAGAGSAVSSGLRAIGANGVNKWLDLPTTKAEADALDAPLMATTAGKVGRAAGTFGILAPTMLIPGANSYAGAALIGGGGGAALTEGDALERAKAAAAGALGGAAGKFAGDKIGAGVRWAANKIAASRAAAQAANAGTDAAVNLAREAGYKLTPSMTGKSGPVTSALEGMGGKIKLQQQASLANQEVTNNLAAKSLGLPEGERITAEGLDTMRRQAGQAYANVAKVGKLRASPSELPKSANVKTFTDPLTLGRRSEVDAADLVEAWKQSNHEATAYYRAYGRDANPETLAKAKAFSSDAKRIDEFLEKALTRPVESARKSQEQLIGELAKGYVSPTDFIRQALGGGAREAPVKGAELLAALKDARVQIAKTYSAEAALNPVTGNINAQKLAQQLAKGKPLSGGMKQAAEFARAFPKAAQSGVDVPAYSPLDAFAASQSKLGALLTLHRPVARATLLSEPYQGLLAAPRPTGAGLLGPTADALESPLAKYLAIMGGQTAGVSAGR